MKKLFVISSLAALLALTGCGGTAQPAATTSNEPAPTQETTYVTKDVNTKDGKRYALTKEETFNIKDNLVLTNLTFEDLEITLSNTNVASYSNGVLTRKTYGTVTAAIGEKGSLFGINYNITFVPNDAFNSVYLGQGRTETYQNINVKLTLTDAGEATVVYSGKYVKEDKSEVEVKETTYSGKYAEKTYPGSVSTNMLIYEINVTTLEEKPQFAFGHDETHGFFVNVSKLPLADGTVFRAQCVYGLK